MNDKKIVDAKNIRKSFNCLEEINILNGVNIEVYKGETIAITGRSGCGKSTLLNILGTLEKPSSGELNLFGKEITNKNLFTIRNKCIGFVFQSNNLLEEYTLLDNLLIKAKIGRKQSTKNSCSYREALHLLDRVGLSHRQNFYAKYLSGGEKQRAAIARALMNNPQLILADEPTGNLDNSAAKNIQDLLINCCKEFQKSLIVVTHDTNFANLCKRVLHLNEGVLVGDYNNIK